VTLFSRQITKYMMSLVLSLVFISVSGCAPMQEKPKAKEQTTSKSKFLEADSVAPAELNLQQLLPPLIVPDGADQRFDVVANDVPAAAFFNSLVDGTGHNLIVHPEVSGTITLNLNNVSVREALSAVRDIYGFDFVESSYGIQILPKKAQTRIFPINYLNVQRKGRSGMQVSSGQVEVTSSSSGNDSNSSSTSETTRSNSNSSEIETKSGSSFWEELQQTLTLMIGHEDNARVVVDAHAGLVIVHGLPNTLNQVQSYLEQTELSVQKQVLIEAKIIEVTLSDGYQAGINWSTIAAQTGNNDVWASQSSVALANPDLIGGIFSLNVDVGDFTGALSLLETQGDVEVLSSPRIATVNNQKAVIKVGSDEFFVTDVSSTNTTTTTGTTETPDIGLTPFFSGIALDVTPQIGDDGEVTLHVHPKVTEVKEKVKKIELNSDEYNLPLAYSTVRETDSIIRARSGQIVVIGGLMQNKTSETVAKVPFFGDLPLIGGLFRQKRQETVQSELVILIQPRIIDTQLPQDRIDQLNRRYSRVLLPEM